MRKHDKQKGVNKALKKRGATNSAQTMVHKQNSMCLRDAYTGRQAMRQVVHGA